jgi:hypothetical protein
MPFIQSSRSPTIIVDESNSTIYQCSSDGTLELAQPPIEKSTAIEFTLSYQVESLAPLADYLEALEKKILFVSLAGALHCSTYTLLMASNKSLSVADLNTSSLGAPCDAPAISCTLLSTQFNVTVNEELEPDVAAFLGYVLVKEQMDSGKFIEDIPLIDKIAYAGPLPLLPPVDNDDEINQEPVQDVQASGRVSVSPWALGVASAACK